MHVYCNAMLHGAPSYSIKKLQRVQNNAARIVLEAPSTADVQSRQHLDAVVPTLPNPGSRTKPQLAIDHDAVSTFHDDNIWERAFRCSAPAVWNSLPKSVLNSDSVVVFKSWLKTFLFPRLSLLALLTNMLPGHLIALYIYVYMFIIIIIIIIIFAHWYFIRN